MQRVGAGMGRSAAADETSESVRGGDARRLAATTQPTDARRGRGATANPDGRFETTRRETFDDGWEADAPAPLRTVVTAERARTLITRNTSPDIPFDRSLSLIHI